VSRAKTEKLKIVGTTDLHYPAYH